MAMNVKFLKGVKKSLPTTRDANTLYFVTDEGALYLGQVLIGANFTSAIEAANAAIKVINDHGYVNSTEVGAAIGTALESYYTKTEVDAKIGTLKIGEVEYASVVEYVIAKTTGIATDSVVAQKADKVVPAKVGNIAVLNPEGNLADGGKTIAEAEANAVSTANAYTDAEIQKLDANVSSTAPETGKGVQVTVVEADGIITSVAVTGNYDEKYDAKGAAAAVLGESGDAATANTVYGAKAAAAAAQSDATIAKTKIETFLGTVTPDGSQDIIDTLAEINTYVGEHGQEFAALSERVTKVENGTTVVAKANADKDGNEFSTTYAKTNDISEDIAKGVTAHGWGNHAEAGYAKAADLGDLAGKNEADLDLTSKQDALSEAQLAAANSGITATKVGEYDTVKQTVDTNKETWDKAGTAVQEVGAKAVDGGGAAFTVDGSEYVQLQSNDITKLGIGYVAASDSMPAYIIFQTNGLEAAGAAAAVQGATTNTVKDCVDAINTMGETKADKTEVANQNAVVLSEAQKYVDDALTWGSF